jgi:glycosyltransferase involved in cell wall biosynthesis
VTPAKPRILFVSRAYPPDVGGIQTHNHDLAAALSEMADVTIIANGRGKAALPWFLPWAAARAVALAPRYDAVLLGDGVLAAVGWLVKKLRPRVCVAAAVHGLDLTWTPGVYQSLWVRRFLPALDLLIAVSTETRRVAEERGLRAERIVVVPNGVDAPDPVPADRPALERLVGRPLGGTRLVLSLGRLVPRKGFAWFAREVTACSAGSIAPKRAWIVARSVPGSYGRSLNASRRA